VSARVAGRTTARRGEEEDREQGRQHCRTLSECRVLSASPHPCLTTGR
jgi:hypothetical protein